ncbi:MAG TPA: APC family permease [Nocardioidaceae bacterium]
MARPVTVQETPRRTEHQAARGEVVKRVLVGRKLRSAQMGETLLPKRIALPVFASDPLSSVAYSPDEIFLTLSLAGLAAYTYSWRIGLAIAFVMIVVVLSYRQNVQAYQSGGGDYEVAKTNLGGTAGLTVASALLVDYVLTVAVSISSAAQYAATTFEPLRGHQVAVAVTAVVFLMGMNLRGVRESGKAFAVPTYLFMLAILGMSAWGFVREFALGGLPDAPSASLGLLPEESFTDGFTGAAAAFLLLRAFASGSATLTGVEAIANGVPAFRKPKGRNAATTLLLLGGVATTMALSIVGLANMTGVKVAEDPERQLVDAEGNLVGAAYHQDPVVGQLARTIFEDFPVGFFFVTAATGVILLLAANTAFNGFPVLASILARDEYMPHQLTTRGDRLAFSNGVVLLAFFSIVLIVAFDAQVTRLIQLYIVGVFVSFTASQTGMVIHWTRRLRVEREAAVRRRMQTSRMINGFGLTVTGTVLVVVLVTKFLHGAWIAILAMATVFVVMKGIRAHYRSVTDELVAEPDDTYLPTRVHAIVLVSKLHKPTMRALAYAKAARPNTLEAVVVDTDKAATARLLEEWDEARVDIPLKVLYSPYRQVVKPVVDYARAIRKASPRGVVAVYLPEYVLGHWWERILHNQSAFRIRSRLLLQPGVTITSVPYQLRSSEAAVERVRRQDASR